MCIRDRHWNVYANYTFLDSETLKSAIDPNREGQALGNTPPHSFNLWTTYEVAQGLSLIHICCRRSA